MTDAEQLLRDSQRMRKTITCRTCSRQQIYEKPDGVSGFPPSDCSRHRRSRKRGAKSWEPIGEPFIATKEKHAP